NLAHLSGSLFAQPRPAHESALHVLLFDRHPRCPSVQRTAQTAAWRPATDEGSHGHHQVLVLLTWSHSPSHSNHLSELPTAEPRRRMIRIYFLSRRLHWWPRI